MCRTLYFLKDKGLEVICKPSSQVSPILIMYIFKSASSLFFSLRFSSRYLSISETSGESEPAQYILKDLKDFSLFLLTTISIRFPNTDLWLEIYNGLYLGSVDTKYARDTLLKFLITSKTFMYST